MKQAKELIDIIRQDTIKEEFDSIDDLGESKLFLMKALKEKHNTDISFTMYDEIYNLYPSYRLLTNEDNYYQKMKDKYWVVFQAVDKRLTKWNTP